MTRSRGSLRRRALNLCFLLYDRKRLEGQSPCSANKARRPHTSSSSSVEGSGVGPSIIHRLDSYLVRMKFSIFLRNSHQPQIQPNSFHNRLTLPTEYGQAQVSPPSTCSGVSKSNELSSRQLRLNPLVGPRIPPFQHILELFVGPGVEVHRFHPADMGAHSSMDARAADADEDAYAP